MRETTIIYSPHFSHEIRKEGIEATLKRWEERGVRFSIVDDGSRITLTNPVNTEPQPHAESIFTR